MQLIVIAGQAGVGKTSLAQIIAKKSFNLGFLPKLISFASPIKEVAEERGIGKKDNPDKYRRFCQRVGAGKRKLDEDYWTKEFEKQLVSIREEERKDIKRDSKYWERCIIVDDCRYPNEIELTLKYKGTLIFLSYGDHKPADLTDKWRNHESEEMAKIIEASSNKKLMSVFNYFLKNEGSLEDLEKQVSSLIPVWCGLQPENGRVITEYNERADSIVKCIDELVDLLLLGEDLFLEEEEEEDEEYEEDA